MAQRILCVAEKPSIAKSVANHLGGGNVNIVSLSFTVTETENLPYMQRHVTGSQYVKNYEFDFAFGPPWGNCSVTMTSVIGHLYGLDFPLEYRKWHSCRPAQLFDAPVTETIDEVSGPNAGVFMGSLSQRTKKP